MNRGVLGIVDDQRSGGFRDCLAENANWTLAYEHYGNFAREGGTTGTQKILSAFPEVTLIHNANTAMAMGSLSAVQSMEAQDRVRIAGWGGTGEELEALLLGELRATPMRMSDDLGVSMAEAIRFDLEGRRDELPLAFVGRITIATGDMPNAQVNAMREEAFRYTGVALLERQALPSKSVRAWHPPGPHPLPGPLATPSRWIWRKPTPCPAKTGLGSPLADEQETGSFRNMAARIGRLQEASYGPAFPSTIPISSRPPGGI